MIERVRPGVVQINSIVGTGSGFIFQTVPSDGSAFVLTNQHVIAGTGKVHVVVNDSETYEATITGSDARRDLADMLWTIHGGAHRESR